MKDVINYLKNHRYKVRFIYWLIVVLSFVFVVLPVFFFFYLFNETQVKQMVIQEFDSNNYHVQVVGHVSPKFWHGLALDFQDVEVQTKGQTNLFKIDNMSCQLSWLDLVFARYKVKRINLNGIDVNQSNVLKNMSLGNLFNLNRAHGSAFDQLVAINIYDVDMIDESSPYKISDGSLQISRDGVAAKFELGFKLDTESTYVLVRGVLDNFTKPILKLSSFQVMMYDGRDFQLKLNATASYVISKQRLTLHDAVGQMSVGKYKTNLGIKASSLDLFGADVKGITTQTSYNNYFASNDISLMVDELYFKNYKQLLINQLQGSYVAKLGNDRLEISSKLEKIHYNESAVVVSASKCTNIVDISVPNFTSNKISGSLVGRCDYLLKSNQVRLDLTGQLNQALLKLKMQVFNQDIPYVIISGNLDNVDLSRIEVSKSRLLPLLYDNSSLPFKWLSLINMKADLSIKRFAFDRINLQNLVTNFGITNGTLNMNRLEADVYGGRLIGSGRIQKVGDSNYNLQTKQIIRSVNLQNMFDDLFDVQAISGSANLTTDIRADNVSSYNDIHKRLTGKILVSAVNGAFQGIDLNLFVNPNMMDLANQKATKFENLQASFDFNNGVSRYGAITFSSKYVLASGTGIIDFDNSKINYGLSIKSALPQNDAKINSVLIPVNVSGDLFSPKVAIKNIHLYTTDIVKPVVHGLHLSRRHDNGHHKTGKRDTNSKDKHK